MVNFPLSCVKTEGGGWGREFFLSRDRQGRAYKKDRHGTRENLGFQIGRLFLHSSLPSTNRVCHSKQEQLSAS